MQRRRELCAQKRCVSGLLGGTEEPDHQRDDFGEFRRFLNFTERANARFALSFVEASARKFDVLQAQRGRHFRRRDVVRTHLVRIDPDVDLPLARADQLRAVAVSRLGRERLQPGPAPNDVSRAGSARRVRA